MANDTTEKTVIGKIKMKVGEWKYITSESFCSTLGDGNLLWSSTDADIVKVNPNSGLLYASEIGTTTVFATDTADKTMRLFCYIEVEETEQYIKEHKLTTNTTSTQATRCCDSGYGDVAAIGYSGAAFEYKILGNRVTLERGFRAKNGTSNRYSDLFRAKLVEMNNIYASLSTTQRGAWMELRLSGLLETIGSMLSSNPSDYLIDYVQDSLIDYFLPLDDIEALLRGLYPWRKAEQDAIAYFDAF